MVTHLLAGGLHYHATETDRTAGSNPCLWGKWIPEKMPTPTCWPKTKKVTCTKSSVSWNTTITYKLYYKKKDMFGFSLRKILCFQSIMWSQSAWMPTTNSGECYLGLLTVLYFCQCKRSDGSSARPCSLFLSSDWRPSAPWFIPKMNGGQPLALSSSSYLRSMHCYK